MCFYNSIVGGKGFKLIFGSTDWNVSEFGNILRHFYIIAFWGVNARTYCSST